MDVGRVSAVTWLVLKDVTDLWKGKERGEEIALGGKNTNYHRYRKCFLASCVLGEALLLQPLKDVGAAQHRRVLPCY